MPIFLPSFYNSLPLPSFRIFFVLLFLYIIFYTLLFPLFIVLYSSYVILVLLFWSFQDILSVPFSFPSILHPTTLVLLFFLIFVRVASINSIMQFDERAMIAVQHTIHTFVFLIIPIDFLWVEVLCRTIQNWKC